MFSEGKITEIYCMADDFCKEFSKCQEKYLVEDKSRRHRNKPNRLNDAKIMVIFRRVQVFQALLPGICLQAPEPPFSPACLLQPFCVIGERSPVALGGVFIKQVLLGTCTGISFVDSTPLRICRDQRILIHKTFKGLAERGKCSMGWSFGFKLHLIINDKEEKLNFMFTPGNVDSRAPLKQEKFLKNIKSNLCSDKGYIGQALFENLFLGGIQLTTKVKNNMRNFPDDRCG